jgi:hypothetical protein
VVAFGFSLILGVPFALGCAAMALPVRRLTKVVIALAPLVLLALSIAMQVFWLGDVGGFVIALIATWAWLVGVGLSGDVRSLGRVVARGLRATA